MLIIVTENSNLLKPRMCPAILTLVYTVYPRLYKDLQYTDDYLACFDI